jgi:hypothetical protein
MIGFGLVNLGIFVFLPPPAAPEYIRYLIERLTTSGVWMAAFSAYYILALALMYSSTRAHLFDRRCSNGHTVSSLAKYCEECGVPVAKPLTAGD